MFSVSPSIALEHACATRIACHMNTLWPGDLERMKMWKSRPQTSAHGACASQHIGYNDCLPWKWGATGCCMWPGACRSD